MVQPPNMDDPNLSDSDTDALFDTPTARKNKQRAQDAGAEAGEGAAGKVRAKESHYTAEEAREAALRQELESVRNVNKVIEGVVESLQKAKDNMGVRATGSHAPTVLITADRFEDSPECFHSPPNMDPHPLADRTQSATHPEPAMAGRNTGHGRY